MSKLIAFRMPDDLIAPFEAKCAGSSLSVTEGMVAAIREWLGREPQRAVPGRTPVGPRTGATVVARPSRPKVVEVRRTTALGEPIPEKLWSNLKPMKEK